MPCDWGGEAAIKKPKMEEKMQYLKIGSYLVRKGLLNETQVKKILKLQQRNSGIHKRFGRIAVNLGYIKENVFHSNIITKYKEEMVFDRYLSVN